MVVLEGLNPPKRPKMDHFGGWSGFGGFCRRPNTHRILKPPNRAWQPPAHYLHTFFASSRATRTKISRKTLTFTSTQSCARAANLNETCLTYLLLIHTYPYSSTSAYPASVVTRPALSLRLRPSTKTNACSVRARMWVRCCAAAACTECRRTEQILSEAAPGALRPGTTAFAYGSPVRRHPAIVAGLVARRVAQRGLLLRKRPGTKLLVTALRPEQSLYARSVHNRETPQHLHMPFRQGYL